MNYTEMDYIIWLSFYMLTNSEYNKLIKQYNNAKGIYMYGNLNNNRKDKNYIDYGIEDAAKIRKYIEKEKIGIILYGDRLYPDRLYNMKYPPLLIYYKGNIEILNEKVIALISAGEEKTYTGLKLIGDITAEMKIKNATCINAFSFGGDYAVSYTFCKKGGKNIVSLDSINLDILTSSQKSLLKEIEKTGIIISRYIGKIKEENTAYTKNYNNILMANICDYMVIIEAQMKSRAMYIANECLELSKNIYSPISGIYDYTFRGSNYLISQGCIPITSKEEITLIC